ncbi:D-amino-acid transaminase [Pseudochelatococcus lubricantis]|uniref:D-amino-acid transaminase n=1 Tax=Pseudochelatococcus lubricantis TaxID=1538102 RepID=UPI0035E68FE4
MTGIVYVNGEYLPAEEAKISVFDRGFLMADAIYELTAVVDGKLIDFPAHLARLDRSLAELDIVNPHGYDGWLALHRELVARNAVTEGSVYVEVTRGNTGERAFEYPPAEIPPTVVAFATNRPGIVDSPAAAAGLRIVTLPDLRWQRRDIKTVQLIYQAQAKMLAKRAGADDGWLVEDGFVTEGTSNNAYIVRKGRIVTRPLGNDILHGITRASLLRFAREAQMEVEERQFTVAEAQAADEAFITSATGFVTPVVEVDGTAVGTGKPGPVALRLREIYIDESRKTAL